MPPFHPEKDEWSVDLSEDAVAARNKDLVPASLQIAINRCLEINIRGIFNYATNHNQDIAATIAAVFKYIFDGSENISEFSNNLKESAPILIKYFEDSNMYQLLLLNEIHSFICFNKYFLPYTGGILHAFYDVDLLDEETIILWFRSYSSLNTEFKIQSQSFIIWLENNPDN